ncbi:LysR family transcriptional regulator [Tahibacter amnicola]|uniref:LysR family transcriptional regulator n=1 Tax=Tahibacter amnicola TaxID=2976241 RepID=A0ABY6BAF8_9GAMM|nr:LysR family transcriptional regulator [Tahibacter amnicola]UXI66782.1 LysR family transcriptional regulator [Tahibacter amnicola]
MRLPLSSPLLESFLVLARELNFSRAADLLHITQPALTKRIQNLESLLGHALLIRHHNGLELTESGRILQRYGSALEHQETELLQSLVGEKTGQLGGFFRIVTYSSALRSVVLPAIGHLLRANPKLSCQASKAEVEVLHDILIDGQVDFCVSLSECERAGIENVQLGVERDVLIESSRYTGREHCYIDHDPRDNFTEKFFLSQTGSTVPRMGRAYFDDIYGLIDAVAEGVGRAVVPVHLLDPSMPVRLVEGFRCYDVPVFLHYHRQPYYTRLQQAVIDTLVQQCAPLLRTNRIGVSVESPVEDDALVAARRRKRQQLPR